MFTIAAGIILAVIALAFWRVALLLGVIGLGLVAALFMATIPGPTEPFGPQVGWIAGILIALVVLWLFCPPFRRLLGAQSKAPPLVELDSALRRRMRAQRRTIAPQRIEPPRIEPTLPA